MSEYRKSNASMIFSPEIEPIRDLPTPVCVVSNSRTVGVTTWTGSANSRPRHLSVGSHEGVLRRRLTPSDDILHSGHQALETAAIHGRVGRYQVIEPTPGLGTIRHDTSVPVGSEYGGLSNERPRLAAHRGGLPWISLSHAWPGCANTSYRASAQYTLK